MGAITRKRDPYPFSNSPDFHVSKKPRFSPMLHCSNQTLGFSNRTVSRIARYPETTRKFRREVHAPSRILKFGLSAKPRSSDYSEKENTFVDNMGNFLSNQLDFAKRNAIGALRFFRKEEVFDVGVESQKPRNEFLSEDSSVEEVAGVEDGREWRTHDGILDRKEEDDDDVEIVEERSVVTGDGNLGLVENQERMMDSLALNREAGVTMVEAYKKLVDWRNRKLKELGFQIELGEKKWSFLRWLRPVKKLEEKPVEIPREPFIPLTKEEEAMVKRAFAASNRRKVLVTHKNSNIDITGQVLMCLAPGAWLNDEVINVYLELLKEREKREPQKFLKCHFFNTFFYKKLVSGKNTYDYRAVKRWTTEKKLGYFLVDCDIIFIPVHREIHWCLAIINKRVQKFQYLDSLKGRDERVLEILARYYVEEVKDKSRKEIDVSDWEQEFVEDLPEQENGFDCGVFMIKYADFYGRGLDLCFGQEHMPYFRLRTAKEILGLRAD